ncbi:4025_t:CDS:2, partial [Cetraspora pellucida]
RYDLELNDWYNEIIKLHDDLSSSSMSVVMWTKLIIRENPKGTREKIIVIHRYENPTNSVAVFDMLRIRT